MYDKKLKLHEVEPETIYISKAERYELIAIAARALKESVPPKLADKDYKTSTQ